MCHGVYGCRELSDGDVASWTLSFTFNVIVPVDLLVI